jgi:hypothetical protein
MLLAFVALGFQRDVSLNKQGRDVFPICTEWCEASQSAKAGYRPHFGDMAVRFSLT